jgi:hypothetical protein
MKFPPRLLLAPLLILTGPWLLAKDGSFNRDSLAVPASNKFMVSLKEYPGLVCPNPRGWYHHVANVVLAKDGSLVACYRLADGHTLLTSYIIVCRSVDGGRTWHDHQVVAHADVWVEHSVWVAPQMSVLKDGRLVIVCDLGERLSGENHPMLSDWQKPDRGMANYIFWSSDNGRTWTEKRKIDDVGGEPSYIVELSNGVLVFTRTESAATHVLKNPPLPWGNIYYRNTAVFSDDGGRTWGRTATVTNNPFQGDAEVGMAEIEPGTILAATRIGLGNGRFGNPSRLITSRDSGQTWDQGVFAPFYAQRPHLGKLQSGKLLVTYRNVWGTPGNRAVVFAPNERPGFQPSSWILNESRCSLEDGALVLRTAEGEREAVDFSLYPAQDDQSEVTITATLRVGQADPEGCAISAGCWVRFLPDRICLSDRPEAGFAFDTRDWHTYRILRGKGRITIEVDGKRMLDEPMGDLWVREVHFGNRAGQLKGGGGYAHNSSVSFWRSVSVRVSNAQDYSLDWSWDPSKGYPDQFRRDRVVVLDYSYPADCGYSSWTQMPDGGIVILDYTNGGNLESFSWGAPGDGANPFVRAYLVKERDLVRS